ncbi:hypothetical protein [Laceyella putida]|uniref:YtxH domain-containing protein n=1 Tax=Laceyella putida TaxID=110101 RepID=A0ABW2RKU8_9BACL
MKWNKMLPVKSPLGWIAVAGVALFAGSPTVRNAVRKAVVKGTAALMEVTDQFKKTMKRAEPSMAQGEMAFDFTSAVSEPDVPAFPSPSVLKTDHKVSDEKHGMLEAADKESQAPDHHEREGNEHEDRNEK